MTEHPILFDAESVRAILAGRKTQTRRVMKPQPERANHERHGEHYTWATRKHGTWFAWQRANAGFSFDPSVVNHCPYGKAGDRLWVRETWALVPTTAYRASDVTQTVCHDFPDSAAVYRAGWPLSPPSRWRSPIHMYRWASRILLTITSVRVERVQDISDGDAIAEGMQCPGIPAAMTNRDAFARRWDAINGKRAPWAANVWVWVINFEVR